MATRALRLGLGLAVGAAVILLLGLASLAAALAGLAVNGFGTVVAYAGNARQMSRLLEPEPAPRLEPTRGEGGRQGVVLVSCLQPPAYQGPGYWAWRLRRRESRGGAAARIHASPSLARVLADLTGDGVSTITLQPLEAPPNAVDAAREAVTHARVREAEVLVAVGEPVAVPAWSCLDERLEDWMAGRPPNPLPDLDPSALEDVRRMAAGKR